MTRAFFRRVVPILLFILAVAPVAAQVPLANVAVAPGDGNRDPNWDWTQDLAYTLFPVGQGAVNVQLPYYANTGPAAGDLNVSPDRDIFPADGWVLVLRNFGSLTTPTPLPFYMLYNKYRGILRLFYWYPQTSLMTRAAAKLSFQGSTLDKTAAHLTFSGPTAEYVNSYDLDKSQVAISEMAPFQWSYFDFDVSGYDPNVPSKIDPTFIIEIYSLNVSDINIEGTIKTDTGTATVAKPEAGNNIQNYINGVLSLYDKPAKRYKQISDAKAQFDQMANANPNTWWGSYLKSIGGLLGKDWFKALGPVAGFVEAILGFGSGSGNHTPLMINATVKLNGSLTAQALIGNILLRLPGAQHASPVSDANNNLLPLYDQPLGIFNLLSPPLLANTNQNLVFGCRDFFTNQLTTDTCRKSNQQRLARVEYVVSPYAGLELEALDAAYLRANALPDFFVQGSSDGYRPVCELTQTVVQTNFGACPPGTIFCPEPHTPPSAEVRTVGLRARLRATASPSVEPTLLIREYNPAVTSSSLTFPCSAPGSANPFKYPKARDQYLACWGIAGQISSNCDTVSEINDKQLCKGMSTSTQTPCIGTTMTDRNLQLACFGMSVAPNYPSNCRDITDAGMRDFCYSVSSWGTWATCSGVSFPADKALCQALTYRNSSYCATITNANDKWFCYGVSSRINSYCGNIVQ